MYKLIISLMLFSGAISDTKINSCQRKREEVIRSLQVIADIPVVSHEGTVIPNKNVFNVYYRDGLTMYKFNYKFDSFSNARLVTQGVWHHFFVHEKGATIGYKYDPHRPETNNLQFSVDSLLHENALQNFKWHQVPLAAKQVFSGIDSAVLKEVYIGPDKYNKAYNDSIIFYYSDKFKTYDFSFSKILDSLRGRKLFKIVLLYPEVYSQEHKITFPKRQMHFEMRESASEDLNEINHYLDKFKRDHVVF